MDQDGWTLLKTAVRIEIIGRGWISTSCRWQAGDIKALGCAGVTGQAWLQLLMHPGCRALQQLTRMHELWKALASGCGYFEQELDRMLTQGWAGCLPACHPC